jgi:hypothetical protein
VPGAQQENADDGQARDEDDPRGQHDQVDSGHPLALQLLVRS